MRKCAKQIPILRTADFVFVHCRCEHFTLCFFLLQEVVESVLLDKAWVEANITVAMQKFLKNLRCEGNTEFAYVLEGASDGHTEEKLQ